MCDLCYGIFLNTVVPSQFDVRGRRHRDRFLKEPSGLMHQLSEP